MRAQVQGHWEYQHIHGHRGTSDVFADIARPRGRHEQRKYNKQTGHLKMRTVFWATLARGNEIDTKLKLLLISIGISHFDSLLNSMNLHITHTNKYQIAYPHKVWTNLVNDQT